MKRFLKTVIISALIIAVCFLSSSQRYLYLDFRVIPQMVSSIEVNYSETVRPYRITDRVQINHIVSNLDSLSFKKSRPFIDFIGSYEVVMLDKNRRCILKCTIVGPDAIYYDNCCFYAETPGIDNVYIINLIIKMQNEEERAGA